MNDQPAAGAPGPATEKRLVTRRHRVRRPLGGGFWLTSLVLVGALAAVTVLTQRAATEEALEAAVKDALRSQTRADVGVVVQGRSVTVRVPAGANPKRVTRLAAQVDGVVAAESATAFEDAEQRRTCSRLDEELDRATDDQRIPFAGETTTLTAEGTALVRSAAEVLLACPVGDVVVGGHTDDDTDRGGELSLARARVILRMLEAAGVDGDRLEPRGYGDQFPIDDADTDAARQANQRGSIAAKGL
jgi:outer membrane protein OmpA-like peptidoglycan-associated protein